MKNNLIILLSILFLLGIFSCNQNHSSNEENGPALFPQPKSYGLNTKEGYKINPVTGDSIKPLVNSLGDTLRTGISLPLSNGAGGGRKIHPDSVSKPIKIKAGKGNVVNAHPNRHKIPDNLTTIKVNQDSLTKILLKDPDSYRDSKNDTSHYILNSNSKKVKTGIKIPVIGKKVKTIQPKSTPALPMRMKDNAIANIQYLDVDQGMNSSYVFSILEDKSGNLWFGTIGGGVSKYDGESFVHFTEKEGLSNNTVWSIIEDKSGNLWFGTDGGGVSKYDGKSFTHYTEKEGLSNNTVLSILEDKSGNLWFGTPGGGVSKYDGESFVHFTEKEGLSNNFVLSILEDKSGNLWFGTYGVGVSKYDGETTNPCRQGNCKHNMGVREDLEKHKKAASQSFVHFTEKEGLSNNTVLSILEDKSGNLWFGTSGGGLSKYDGTSFTHYTEKEGLCNNTVSSILEDKSGNLWLSTEKGITQLGNENNKDEKLSSYANASENKVEKKEKNKLLKSNSTIQILIKQDGLKGLDFHTNSAFIDSKNRAWWGSGKGLEMLDLNKYKISQKIPNPVLKQIDINENFIDYRNITDSLKNEIIFSGVQRFQNYPLNLELPYDKNHLTFHFAAIDWAAPHKIKYQYKMEGLDENWSEVTDQTKADFRNLPYGTYTFKVRAIGESQIWSKPFEYTFTIHPPWWHTAWFRVIYFSFFVLLLYLLFRWRTKSLRERQKQLEKTVEERTADVVAEKKVVEEQKHLVEEKQKEIIDSINYAQRLQQAILATKEEIDRNIPENFLLYIPKDIVAGDFYFFEVTDDFIFYAAADCTGHGVPGAMVSIVCSNALTRSVKEFGLTDPGNILDKTRELILETFKKSGEDVKDGMDISFISINKKTKEIKWAGANNPLWYIENGEMKEIKADKQPIGKTDNPKPFTSHSLPLCATAKADGGTRSLSALFLFTDGFADQFGGVKGKKFKYSNLQKLLLDNANEEPKIINEKLNSVFFQWKGDLEQVDDVCIIGIRV